MSVVAVLGVQYEQEGAEHTALGGSGCVAANLNCLGSGKLVSKSNI